MVEGGCVLWGSRVITPNALNTLLHDLHPEHMGSSKLKSLARGHILWPGLDKEMKTWEKLEMSALQSNKLHLGLHFKLGFGHLDLYKDYTSIMHGH